MFFTKKPKDLTTRSTKEIIEEIHETFYTEVDRLLSEAKISNSLDTDKQDLIDKCRRLKALGFTKTKEVEEAEYEINRLNKLKQDNKAKKEMIEAINYFSFKYPNYKFITEESVKNICAKYNLVYGEISRYIGTVPDKNLKHIEDFKISEEDECFATKTINYFGEKISYITYSLFKENESDIFERERRIRLQAHGESNFDIKCPLEIAAPLKDFNMTEAEIKDFKISKIDIPDPVVLKPVMFNGKKHYLIVTAWGDEASDELVVNQRLN